MNTVGLWDGVTNVEPACVNMVDVSHHAVSVELAPVNMGCIEEAVGTAVNRSVNTGESDLCATDVRHLTSVRMGYPNTSAMSVMVSAP